MSVRLRIRNFGPVGEGYTADDGWMTISRVTLFCGPQGSGKSSVTKLLSLLSWLEKSVYRNPELTIDGEVFEQALEWQKIESYLKPDTEIEYSGDLLQFSCRGGAITAKLVFDARAPYVVPKISYMPAERNFASIVRNASRVEGLPSPLIDMQLEFDRAKRFYAKGYRLPANGFRFKYDQEAWIVNGDGADANMTRLDEASSGLQAMVPMLLVSEYLASHLAKDDDADMMGLFYDPGTSEKKERIEMFKRDIRARKDLTADQKRCRLEQYFAPGRRFLNIVEEPEQNLYPETQCAVLGALVATVTSKENNGLVLSTHSPFILCSLNNLISKETLSSSDVSAYHLHDGTVEDIFNRQVGLIDAVRFDDVSTRIADGMI